MTCSVATAPVLRTGWMSGAPGKLFAQQGYANSQSVARGNCAQGSDMRVDGRNTPKIEGILIFPLLHFVSLLGPCFLPPYSKSLCIILVFSFWWKLTPSAFPSSPQFAKSSCSQKNCLYLSCPSLIYLFSKLEGTLHSHLPWIPFSLPFSPQGPWEFLTLNHLQCLTSPLPWRSCWAWLLE